MAQPVNSPKNSPSARDRVLAEATALFAQKGYAATSIREIVTQAGVTKPVLYYYFKNKEALFQAIIEEAAERLDHLLQEPDATEGSIWARINGLCNRFYDYLRNHRDLVMVVHSSLFGPDRHPPTYNVLRFRNRVLMRIEAICREGITAGELAETDPKLIAKLVLAIINSSIFIDLTLFGQDRPGHINQLLVLAYKGLSREDISHV